MGKGPLRPTNGSATRYRWQNAARSGSDMVSLWTAVPEELDGLLARGDIAAAAELYDSRASLVSDEAPAVVGRQAVCEALQAYQETVAFRYYVRRLRVPKLEKPITPHGEPQTYTALGWCVRTTSGLDEAIEQHYERVWNSDWRVVAERRTTTLEQLPPLRRRVPMRVSGLAKLFTEVCEYAEEFQSRLDWELSVENMPAVLAARARRLSAMYPFEVLAVLLRHGAQHGVIQMARWRLAWVMRRAAAGALGGRSLPALGEGADAHRVILGHLRESWSAYEHADMSRTRHDLVLQWLEDQFVERVAGGAPAGTVADHVVQLRSTAHWLVDPLYQWWLEEVEMARGFRWRGECQS